MKTKKTVPVFSMVFTIVTMAALACSSGGLPSAFATKTPTPTYTSTPTSTTTPSPSPTMTQTPSPTSTPLPTGVSAKEQPDGSTLFIDYDNQYQLTLPKDWVVILPSSPDLVNLLYSLSEKNPALGNMVTYIAMLNPDMIRVIALNIDPAYIDRGFAANFSVTAIGDTFASSIPLDLVMDGLEDALKRQGAKLINSSPVSDNSHGVETGTYDFQQTSPAAAGTNILVRAKGIVFKSNEKLITIELAIPAQSAGELLPMVDTVADSIQLLMSASSDDN